MERLTVEHYPFKVGEEKNKVRAAIFAQYYDLIKMLPLPFGNMSTELISSINQYFNDSEVMFNYELEARAKGEVFANLFYHLRDHAVYQTTFDAASTLRSILARRDSLSSHLSKEGVVATLIGAMRHDIGFVTSPDSPNYAARSPIHVEESMENIKEAIKRIGLPPFLNADRVTELAVLGVHNTYFPYQKQHRAWMRSKLEAMEPNQRKEAHIVRLTVQFADLGGQVARVDYFPNLLRDLRREMNAARPGSGIKVIGQDDQLAFKCQGFINFVMKPMVGKTGNAFFGKDNAFQNAWIKHLESITEYAV